MKKKIAYFAGCAANYVDPDVGKATILVLERNGFEPVFPGQVCCGIPQWRQGNFAAGIRKARANLATLAKADCEIVTSCTTCALVLKHYYPLFLECHEAVQLAQRTYETSEYLSILWGRGALDMSFQAMDLSLLYHAPCHLKALGSGLIDSRLKLMSLIPGVSVSRIDRGCCGMAGTFGAKKKTRPLTVSIMEGLAQGIRESEADMAVTDCPTCRLQIEQNTLKPVIHPVQVFRDAYGLG